MARATTTLIALAVALLTACEVTSGQVNEEIWLSIGEYWRANVNWSLNPSEWRSNRFQQCQCDYREFGDLV